MIFCRLWLNNNVFSSQIVEIESDLDLRCERKSDKKFPGTLNIELLTGSFKKTKTSLLDVKLFKFRQFG